MSTAALNSFVEAIFRDPTLATVLQATDGDEEADWLPRLVQLGIARGLSFTAEEALALVAPGADPAAGRLAARLVDDTLHLTWHPRAGAPRSALLHAPTSFDHIFACDERPALRLTPKEAVVAICSISLGLEGEPRVEELDVIERLLDELEIREVDRTPLLSWLGRQLSRAPGPLFNVAREAITGPLIEQAFVTAAQVALADHVVTPEEYNYLGALARALEIAEPRADALVQEALARHLDHLDHGTLSPLTSPTLRAQAATSSSASQLPPHADLSSTPAEALAALRRHLEANHWPIARADDHHLHATYRSERDSWRCVATIEADGAVLAFRALCPFSAAPSRRAAVAEYLLRANATLPLSVFEMRYDSGEVRCRTSVCIRHLEVTRSLIGWLVRDNVVAMERFLEGLATVVDGAEPAEAFALAG